MSLKDGGERRGLLSLGFEFVMDMDRRRGCGNVGIAERFPRALESDGKPVFGFSRFPRPVISTAPRFHAGL